MEGEIEEEIFRFFSASLPLCATIAYASAGQTVAPLYLKWALVFGDPNTRCVWIGKALPREWLEAREKRDCSKKVTVANAVRPRWNGDGIVVDIDGAGAGAGARYGAASLANTGGRAAMAAGAAAAVYT